MRLRWYLGLALLTVPSLSLPGCFFHHPYPSTWAHVLERDIVQESFEGIYSCIGEDDKGVATALDYNLGSILFNDRRSACDRIAIHISGSSSIELSSYKSDLLVKKAYISSPADYSFSGNCIRLKRRSFSGAYDLGYTWERLDHSLYLQGNDLVIKREDRTIGTLFFVVPLGGSGRRWLKFKKMANQAL